MSETSVFSPSQEFVYIRTYSRWLEDKKRRETWDETVNRYINFILEERGNLIPSKVIKKIREKLTTFDVMPSMRALWSAGQAAKDSNVCMYNCSALVIDSVDAFAEVLYVLCCGSGVGFSVQNEYINKLPIIPYMSFNSNGIYKIPDNKEGWAKSIKILMNSLYEGKDIELDYSLIRPAGTRLKTMGGRASGPEPLMLLHRFIRDTFCNAQGRKLNSLECNDILNQIAEIVVVGGVRRSSQISLSDLNDSLLANAKKWPFPIRRSMSNNSAVYPNKPSAVEFLQEWSELASSGTGERGIFNLYAIKRNAPERRDKAQLLLVNPCVSGNTEILTKNGYTQISSVVNEKIEIWNGFEWSLVTPKITGYNQPMVLVTLSDGRQLNCTEYHKFKIITDYKGNTKDVEAKNLETGMKLIKHNFPIISNGLILANAYTQGFISAEGMDNYDCVDVYSTKYMCLKRLEENMRYLGNEQNNKRRLFFKEPKLPKNFVPLGYDLSSKLCWLAGLFDGDGTELKEGGLQISSIDHSFLYNTQKLLSTIGVQAKVVDGVKEGFRKLPDGKGGHKEYFCKETKRLCIGALQMQFLKDLGLKCERLLFNKMPNRDAGQYITIVDVSENGIEDIVYCFNEPKRHLGVFNGIITGQCHEIVLRNMQFCNLSEVVIKENDDLDSLLDKVETATWIGIIQSTFTDFKFLRPKWKENCEEERLLGVSLTGQMDNKELLSDIALKALKAKVLKIAKHASAKMGINTPTATTCCKPSGTVSQLVNSSSGIHPRYAKYYIRRYRISTHDPLLKMIKHQNIRLLPENGQEHLPENKVSTWIIEFPIKSPLKSVLRDYMSAIKQMEWYKHVITNWCEHSASCTIYVKEDEWLEVGNWVYKNWDIVNGLSFLPYDGGKYKLAPYEEITEAEYNKLIKEFKNIDYSKLSEFEIEDNTEGVKTFACTSGMCELN